MSKLPFFSALCAVFLIVPILWSKPGNESPAKLVEFYTVDVWDDDYYPYWQSAIVHITPQEGGVKLQYTYIASATQPCNDPAVKGATVFLPKKPVEDLTNGLNLCRIDPFSFNESVEKYTKKPEPFSTVRSAVVAVCGTEQRVFKMPRFKMNDKVLEHKEPSARKMSELTSYLLRKAFPIEKTRDILWGVDSTLSDAPPDGPQVEELKSGEFDKAYWFGFKGAHPAIPAQVVTTFDPTVGSDSDLGKLRNVLTKYKQPSPGKMARTGTLVDSQGYKLSHFVAPVYSPLAVQTHIEGRVTLSLTLNRATGQVENAEVTHGHALLGSYALDSAKRWRFEPSQTLPEKITAVLDFSLHCSN